MIPCNDAEFTFCNDVRHSCWSWEVGKLRSCHLGVLRYYWSEDIQNGRRGEIPEKMQSRVAERNGLHDQQGTTAEELERMSRCEIETILSLQEKHPSPPSRTFSVSHNLRLGT